MTTMTASKPVVGEIVDPTTCEGFAQIAATFGIESAFTAKINALRQRVVETRGVRWHFVQPERELFNAEFDFAWYLADGNPQRCKQFLTDIREA